MTTHITESERTKWLIIEYIINRGGCVLNSELRIYFKQEHGITAIKTIQSYIINLEYHGIVRTELIPGKGKNIYLIPETTKTVLKNRYEFHKERLYHITKVLEVLEQ
jgi:hypothetical protein